jgi:hypothetical protein
MSKFVSSCMRPVLFGLLALGIAAAPAAQAKGRSLARFAGSGTGLILISQGSTALVGNANPKVKANARSARFLLKCTINNVAVTQTITLKNGRARISHLLPGVSGFQESASGRYSFHGSTVRITAPFSGGTLYMEIDTTTFGSTLRISEQLVYTNGTATVYSTVIGT